MSSQQQDQNDAAQAQKEADELREQIELNQAYENEIKKAINDSMPFISELQPLATVEAEYAESKFSKCFEPLFQRYTQIRRLRRDGNCFYRAFLF